MDGNPTNDSLLIMNVFTAPFGVFVVVHTLNAGLAPSSSRHRTAAVQRLAAAMCRAVPKSKSLQVASTSETEQTWKCDLILIKNMASEPSRSFTLAHLPAATPATPHG